MKRYLVVAALLISTLTAYAGKEEREYMKNTVVPAVKEAEAKFKSACGCAFAIKVSDGLKTQDEMAQARNISNTIAEGAPKHCTDAESKKAMCALKTLDIVKGPDTKFTFAAGKGTAVTDGQSYVSWEMITREVDK